MQSLARSLTATAALLVAAVISILVGATPQTQETPTRKDPTSSIAPAPPAGPPIAPITFADPDGQELILEKLEIRTAIQGMLSLTELEMRFRNPQARRIEGRFTCTLPPNAAISRFAKDVNGQLMEGEVVERLRANQVYEQYLHQMRDPALLEQDQGNRFSARIFPIEANQSVRLILSYTALLPMRDGTRTYTLPLRGLSKVNQLTFRAIVSALPGEEQVGAAKSSSSISGPDGAMRSTAEVITFEERDTTPSKDVVLSWRPTAAASRSRVLKAGDFYLASFRPEVERPQGGGTTHDWLFYVDTSASSAEGSEHRIRALESLFAALPASDRVQVIAFDQELASIGSGSAAELASNIGARLRTRLFLGGTDLDTLFRDVAKNAQRRDRAIVIASDLVATLGATERKSLTDAILAIPPQARVHALILGSRQDSAIAKTLTAGRGRTIEVPFSDRLEASARDAVASLQRPPGASVDVTDASAEWIYPTHFDDVQPGDEVIVLGKLAAAAEPNVRINGAAVGELSSVALPAGTFAPLLEREGYRAYLDYLAEREANEPSEAVRRALASEQVTISVQQRVVIPRTTMLVLESEWEYRRWNLDRRALAAILTIDAGGIARIDRKGLDGEPVPVLQSRPMPPVVFRDEAQRKSARPTAPAPMEVPTDAMARADEDVEEGVEGGVEGGVAGGVMGGVAGGSPGGMIAGVPSPVPEAMTVNAAAPARAQEVPPEPQQSFVQPPPSPPPAPRIARRENEEKRTSVDWTKRVMPTRAKVEELEAKLRDDPRDRERYNQLGEALALLGEWSRLRKLALQWQPFDPENPQVYELLAMAAEHLGNESEAARASGSLIEVAPAKTELLQRAGLLLLRSGKARLAEAPLRKALEVRPDRVNSYRHLALMLWRDGRVEQAARVLESATRQTFPNWYGDAQRVVREELGYVYRAWIAKEPARRPEIEDRAREHSVDLARRDALRVTLAWETDANDVDLHVVDPRGEDCFYAHKNNASGLELYGDITQGLGPEVIRTNRLEKGTYHVGVRYFSAGPMGISRGLVVIVRDDGSGNPSVEIEPFRLAQGGGEIRYVTGVSVK